MSDPGIFSLLPPFLAIFLAIRTRQVYISLLAGIFCAFLILNQWNPITAFLTSIEALVGVFKDEGNTRTIFFCALVGGLLSAIRHNGGVSGFVQYVQKRAGDSTGNIKAVKLELAAYVTGLLLFIETSISALTVGAIFKPLFDRNGISREKLALLADTSSAPSSILIPLNAWGAFIVSLLVANGIQQPFSLMVQSMPYNFYPLVLLPLMFFLIYRRRDLGLLRSARAHAFEESSSPSEALHKDRPVYLILPILSLVVSLPVLLVWDGWLTGEGGGLLDRIFASIGRASGTKSVLLAVVLSIVVTGFQSRIRHGRWRNGFSQSVLQGTVELVPLALLMILAFAIGQACRDLETGIYLSSVVQSWIPSAFLPMIIFLISCLVSFSTGTSWGTFAIMMSISIPLAQSSSLHLPLVVAAVLSGGVFGDHCSPISDTTIISSMASGSDHIAHVRTQMPYALIAGGVSAVFFAMAGFWV